MIKVMSFNIRYGRAPDGENRWERRRRLALARIQSYAPDLLGLQECRADGQARYVRRNLPGYDFYGVPRGGEGETALEMAPWLVRKTSFTILEKGCFWLSETPDLPGSRGWDGVFPRTVSWARLRCSSSQRELVYANTHFDYQPGAIDGAAGLLADWIDSWLPGLPVILTGDFNIGKDSPAYQRLTAPGRLMDALRLANPGQPDAGTFHAFGLPFIQAPIDWLLVSEHFKAVEAGVETHRDGDLFPSDHYPIWAVLDWA